MISGPASVKAEPPVAMDAWHWVHGNPWFLLTRQDLECPVPLLQRQCHLRRVLRTGRMACKDETSGSVWTDSVGAQGNGTASMVWVSTLPSRLAFHCISIPPPACRVLLDLEREQLPATKLETDDEGLVVRRIAQ